MIENERLSENEKKWLDAMLSVDFKEKNNSYSKSMPPTLSGNIHGISSRLNLSSQ